MFVPVLNNTAQKFPFNSCGNFFTCNIDVSCSGSSSSSPDADREKKNEPVLDSTSGARSEKTSEDLSSRREVSSHFSKNDS